LGGHTLSALFPFLLTITVELVNQGELVPLVGPQYRPYRYRFSAGIALPLNPDINKKLALIHSGIWLSAGLEFNLNIYLINICVFVAIHNNTVQCCHFLLYPKFMGQSVCTSNQPDSCLGIAHQSQAGLHGCNW
jgi:hypothetical protein